MLIKMGVFLIKFHTSACLCLAVCFVMFYSVPACEMCVCVCVKYYRAFTFFILSGKRALISAF